MAEGKSPESGLRLGMTKEHGLALKRKEPTFSRKQALRFGVGAAVAAVGVARGGQILEGAKDFLDSETAEQGAAKKKWEEKMASGSNEGVVSDLEVIEDRANVRNEARRVDRNNVPDSQNKVIKILNEGDRVPKALIWEGMSPDIRGKKDVWYTWPMENGRMGFSYSRNFKYPKENLQRH